MAKRLFSTDKRAETILAHLRDQDANLSSFISNSVVDETLPVYSSLRTEALYLLDFITDGAKDWVGSKLILETGADEKDYVIRQTLGRGVSWLQRNHHIKNGTVLKEIIHYYQMGPEHGGILLENLNQAVTSDMEKAKKMIKEIDPDYADYHVGLGNLARDILDRWDKLWDNDLAYLIIIDTIYCEKTFKELDPFWAIKMVQIMENQFIIEAIGERK